MIRWNMVSDRIAHQLRYRQALEFKLFGIPRRATLQLLESLEHQSNLNPPCSRGAVILKPVAVGGCCH
mgnify:CR=1 FL=1